MSLLINQTAVNPTQDFFLLNSSGSANSTSYANPNVVNFTIPGLASGAGATLALVNPLLYTDVNKLYRLTICYEYASATFATTPSGPITLSIFNGNIPSLLLATHSVPFTATVPNGNQNIGGVLTAIIRPVAASGGGTVAMGLVVLNSSGVVLTSASVVCTVFAVEEITDNFTLITTTAGGLIPPPS
jgi:hypothetical protein